MNGRGRRQPGEEGGEWFHLFAPGTISEFSDPFPPPGDVIFEEKPTISTPSSKIGIGT